MGFARRCLCSIDPLRLIAFADRCFFCTRFPIVDFRKFLRAGLANVTASGFFSQLVAKIAGFGIGFLGRKLCFPITAASVCNLILRLFMIAVRRFPPFVSIVFVADIHVATNINVDIWVAIYRASAPAGTITAPPITVPMVIIVKDIID